MKTKRKQKNRRLHPQELKRRLLMGFNEKLATWNATREGKRQNKKK